MNLLQQLLQKIGLIGAVLITWILDAIPFLSNDTVWLVVKLYLAVIKMPERFEPLQTYWGGDIVVNNAKKK